VRWFFDRPLLVSRYYMILHRFTKYIHIVGYYIFLCRGINYAPYSFLLISNKFCNGGWGGGAELFYGDKLANYTQPIGDKLCLPDQWWRFLTPVLFWRRGGGRLRVTGMEPDIIGGLGHPQHLRRRQHLQDCVLI
jgi:hypothetical protein